MPTVQFLVGWVWVVLEKAPNMYVLHVEEKGGTTLQEQTSIQFTVHTLLSLCNFVFSVLFAHKPSGLSAWNPRAQFTHLRVRTVNPRAQLINHEHSCTFGMFM